MKAIITDEVFGPLNYVITEKAALFIRDVVNKYKDILKEDMYIEAKVKSNIYNIEKSKCNATNMIDNILGDICDIDESLLVNNPDMFYLRIWKFHEEIMFCLEDTSINYRTSAMYFDVIERFLLL